MGSNYIETEIQAYFSGFFRIIDQYTLFQRKFAPTPTQDKARPKILKMKGEPSLVSP
jgi:hypothetical protein